jgi:hypothetical protein
MASTEDGAQQGILMLSGTVLQPVARARIVLKPCRKMTVQVTDAAKKPVKRAAVGLFDDDAGLIAAAETNPKGVVSLRFPRDCQVYQVVALKPHVGFDYFENYRSWPGSIMDEPPAHVALVLDGARSIRVKAVDAADKALPDIDLTPLTVKKKGKLSYVNLSGAKALKFVTARTNRDGLATFDWLPKSLDEPVSILLLSDRKYSLPNAPYLDLTHPDETLVARLDRNVHVQIGGKVTLPDGKPAAGILLQVQGHGSTNNNFRGLARTSSDGRYSLLAYPNQSYIVAVTDESWAAPSKTGIVINEGAPRMDLDFRLGKGTVIRGRVTLGRDSKPGAKQWIMLIEQGVAIPRELGGERAGQEALIRWATTDKDGNYSIRVWPGKYQISGPTRGQQDEIEIKADAVIEKDFRLERLNDVDVVLKGLVLAHAGDGKPVAGAIVRYFSTGLPTNAVADERGRFQTITSGDKIFLHARSPDGSLATMITVGEDDEAVTIVLLPAGKFRGRVIDKAGKPLAGVLVFCSQTIGPQEKPTAQTYENIWTDDDGRFTILGVVPGAKCEVHAYKGYADRTQSESRHAEVPAAKAETLDLGDFLLDLDLRE